MARHRGSGGSLFDAPGPGAGRRGSNAKTAIRASLAVMIPALIMLFFAVQILGQGGAGEADDSADGGPVTSHEQLTVPDQPGGGVPVGQVDIRVKEGRTNGQREFVGEFVEAAYAPAGSTAEDYRVGMEEYVEPASYYESEGGRALEEIENAEAGVPEAGGAAELVEYEIVSGPPVGSSVTASELRGFVRGGSLPSDALSGATLAELVYSVGEQTAESSGVSGEGRYYEQELVLIETSGDGQGWAAIAASAPDSVEDPGAGAPASGAPKVGEPNRGGMSIDRAFPGNQARPYENVR